MTSLLPRILLATIVVFGPVSAFVAHPLPHLHSRIEAGTARLQAADDEIEKPQIEPDILNPFPPAADPMYMCRGPVGKNEFVLTRTGGPTKEELANENIVRIVKIECDDLEVNTLVWKCLGYRFDEENEEWNNDLLFPKWREKYPTPPDLIGMQRIYSKEVDRPCLKSNQSLVKSVPVHAKQSLKTHLKPLGFKGYKIAELTPNKTRRAQCANWLIYYREELFGYSVEELKARREKRKDAEAKAEAAKNGDEWKPPVTEVF
jgi:hypothetical protein